MLRGDSTSLFCSVYDFLPILKRKCDFLRICCHWLHQKLSVERKCRFDMLFLSHPPTLFEYLRQLYCFRICLKLWHLNAARQSWRQPPMPLHWRYNERDDVSNHQPRDCLLKHLFRHRSKKTSKLRVTGLCEGNSPVTGEFPAQTATNAENVSIWWRHHATGDKKVFTMTTPGFCCGLEELHQKQGLIWIMGSGNERRHYKIMPPLFGWDHIHNDTYKRRHFSSIIIKCLDDK